MLEEILLRAFLETMAGLLCLMIVVVPVISLVMWLMVRFLRWGTGE